MRTRRGKRVLLLLMGVAMLAAPALAAGAKLERVLLLPSVDRSSIVFELTTVPRQVSTRRISDSVVELEATFDTIDNVGPQLLKAPSNVRFVDSVSVRVMSTGAGQVMRARIALSSMAQAVVRGSGRRVYVDVSPLPKALAVAPSAPSTQAAAVTVAAPPTPRATPEQAFQAAMRPSIDKLKELGPFLTSAAASGDPKVTSAVLPNLMALRASLAAQQPPESLRGSHTMVLSAIDRILHAYAVDFTGDRVTTVKQSVTTIQVVGGVLVGE